MNKVLISIVLSISFGVWFAAPVSGQGQADSLKAVQFIDSLIQSGRTLMNTQAYDSAQAVLKVAARVAENNFGKNHPLYATAIGNQGRVYILLTKYAEAEPYYREAQIIREKVIGKENNVYAGNLISLGIIASHLNNFAASENYYLEAQAILLKLNGRKSPNYPFVFNNLGALYYEAGQYEKAEKALLEAKSALEETGQTNDPTYFQCMVNLGAVYTDLQMFGKAAEYYLFAIQAFENNNLQNTPDYAATLSNLGSAYSGAGRYAEAEPRFLKSLEITEKVIGKNTPNYAVALGNVAGIYYKMNNFDKAEPLFAEAKSTFESAGVSCEKCYLIVLKGIGQIKMARQQYAAAAADFRTVLAASEKFIGVNNDVYLEIAMLLLEASVKAEEKETISALFSQNTALEKQLLRRASGHFSQPEIIRFLPRIQSTQNWFGTFALSGAISPADLNTQFYNDILFRKGYFLNFSLAVNNLVSVANDSIQRVFAQWKNAQAQLSNIYSQPVLAQEQAARIAEESVGYEKLLVQNLSGFAELQRDINWQEVQHALKPGEAAVEFVHFKDLNKGDSKEERYAALLLLPGSKAPLFISLFGENELLQLISRSKSWLQDYTQNLYAQKQPAGVKNLYQLIWEPLEKHLADVKTVYYAPAGLLHRLNIGAIEAPDRSRTDRRKLVLLGSTRQVLPVTAQNQPGSNALVIGGVQYDEAPASSGNSAGMSSRNRGIDFSYENADSTLRGNAWDYLPKTLSEAQKIAGTLEKSGIKAEKITGAGATEEVFKQRCQSGSTSPRIVHIATHGFFFPDAQNSGDTIAKAFKTNENPMMRSGLILAGANHAWKTGKTARTEQEDGILTAYEISLQNLSNTELVVLSACETGLGDIAGNEGVYGLQRAFKIAGARYLIMSLWKVPDEQTEQLMTLFYEKWLNGKKAIPDAFREAQAAMQAKNPNPFYWAGFVLLE